MYYGIFNITLYVPTGSKEEYASADTWSLFTNIVEEDISDIDTANAEDRQEVARYNAAGQKLSQPEAGLNIIVYDNGTVEKIMLK